jgi:hypothetical protein
MAGSADEREIRDATIAFIRENFTNARVVHELVIGQCRADLAAIEPERLTLFEIKSRKDTLNRLKRQVSTFERASHLTVVVAHAKWFEEFDHAGRAGRGFRQTGELSGIPNCWRYPKPVPGEFVYSFGWQLPRPTIEQPHARRLLEVLWKAELLAECQRHRVSATTRSTCETMIRDLAYHLTGREIAQAVCRQLRGRPFPEADEPIHG